MNAVEPTTSPSAYAAGLLLFLGSVMAKLTMMRSRIPTAKPRIAASFDDERNRSRHRDATQEHRKWYKTSRWQKLRLEILTRDHFTCAMCKRVINPYKRGEDGKIDPENVLICDHIQPHRGNEALFWDVSNLQTLCKPCHDSPKQSEEKQSLHMQGVWY